MVVVLVLCALLGSVLAILVPSLSHGLAHVTTVFTRGPMHLIGGPGMDVAILALCIPLAAVVGGIFLAALRILKGESGRKSNSNNAEEARMIQDIYHGLGKMEQRIEALETLLLDRQRKGNER
jgi:phage shock protein B